VNEDPTGETIKKLQTFVSTQKYPAVDNTFPDILKRKRKAQEFEHPTSFISGTKTIFCREIIARSSMELSTTREATRC
jgi:hypothetical protein